MASEFPWEVAKSRGGSSVLLLKETHAFCTSYFKMDGCYAFRVSCNTIVLG